MKRFFACVLALASMFVLTARAGDYGLIRDTVVLPGGLTNSAKVYLRPSGWCGELIEFHMIGAGSADTATVSRVSACKCFTNTLCTVSNTAGVTASVSLTATNFTAVTTAQGANDYILVAMTGTNKPATAQVVWKAHPGTQQ